MTRPRVIVIVGPTSSGKSALAVEIARKIGGEVISADSRQVYKGLDIGTGKITKREMKGVRHHLLDVASPKKVFTAHDFSLRGREAIENIVKRGNIPIVCGGTGFYIDALLGRVSLPNVPANKRLRAKLAKKSAAALYEILKKLDARRAQTIDRQNPVRLVRAIEIAKALGKVPMPRPGLGIGYDIRWIGIKPDDKTLRMKIHIRLFARLRQGYGGQARTKEGMITEAKLLHKKGLSYKRMEQLGLEYRYLARYLQGKITKQDILRDLEQDIWHYAKRQMTYWRRNPEIRWTSDAKKILASHSFRYSKPKK